MSKVIWIASYPKSGNTWVRFLACNLMFGPVDSAAALARMVPDIHELPRPLAPPPHPLLMKTHWSYSPAHPLAEYTAGAIYVVRDAADVMLSNFNYGRRSGAIDRDDPEALDRYLDRYIAARGDPRWIELGMGSWESHMQSWLGNSHPFPILRICYEDLIGDPCRVATQLCLALNLRRSEEDIDLAVAASSFDRLRAIEEADIVARRIGIFYKPYLQSSIDTGLRFMGSGRRGEAERLLTPIQRQRFERAFSQFCDWRPLQGRPA